MNAFKILYCIHGRTAVIWPQDYVTACRVVRCLKDRGIEAWLQAASPGFQRFQETWINSPFKGAIVFMLDTCQISIPMAILPADPLPGDDTLFEPVPSTPAGEAAIFGAPEHCECPGANAAAADGGQQPGGAPPAGERSHRPALAPVPCSAAEPEPTILPIRERPTWWARLWSLALSFFAPL